MGMAGSRKWHVLCTEMILPMRPPRRCTTMRRGLRADERAVEVEAQHIRPGLVVEVEERRGLAASCVVDKTVQFAELGGEIVDDVARAGKLLQVELAHGGAPSRGADLSRRVLGAVAVRLPADADVAAALREERSRGLADAGIPTP